MGDSRTVAVAGAGATNIKSTVAINLALAIAKLGPRVELQDEDPDRHAARALTGTAAHRVAIRSGGPLEIRATPVAPLPENPEWSPGLRVLDCAPRLGGDTMSAIESSHAVIVPVDGSPLSLRALDAIARVRTRGGGELRVLLARGLPRTVDRWTLVDGLMEVPGVTLSPATVPMGRAARRAHRDSDVAPTSSARSRRATLYAPGTRAARAYLDVAAQLLRALEIVRPQDNRDG